MEVAEIDTSKIDELQAKLNDLQEKYKKRFLEGAEEKTEEKDEEKTEELEEKEVIDVKEI